jgi:hypothetical protein
MVRDYFLMQNHLQSFKSGILETVGRSQQICSQLFLVTWKTHLPSYFLETIADALNIEFCTLWITTV